MDPIGWLVLAGLVSLLLGIVTFIHFKSTKGQSSEEQSTVDGGGEGVAAMGGGGGGGEGVAAMGGGGRIRRPQTRNVRARLAALQRARGERPEEEGEEPREEGSEEEYEENMEDELMGKKGKIGTKKMKRIREKEERKAAREQEAAMREDKKEREALRDEERKRAEKQEKIRLKKEEEEERLRKEEQERKEQEEYMALKESFVVEEEGEGAKGEGEEARSIRDFIDYIKKVKVVYMEDLGGEFGLKTQDAIARVQSLQESGELSGVVDDRGKFIYISEEEMKAVAQFIKQRGRVSITELVSSSNRLINLQPEIQSN